MNPFEINTEVCNSKIFLHFKKIKAVLSREISGTGRSRQKMASSPAQNYFADTQTIPAPQTDLNCNGPHSSN